MKIPQSISSAEQIIRAVTSAQDKRQALYEEIGKPGSKKRKGLPKSLRKKVHAELFPEYTPHRKNAPFPMSAVDFAFRDELRRIDEKNSLHSLENERKALKMLDETMQEILSGQESSVREKHKILKQTFDHYGVSLADVLLSRYENLTYNEEQKEASAKNIYGKLVLYKNDKFDPSSFSPDGVDFEEIVKVMAPLDGDEKRIFIGTVIFDPSLESEDMEQFIPALTVAADHGDEVFNLETHNAIASIGGSMLEQVFQLAETRFASRQDYSMAEIKYFQAGVTTKKHNPEQGFEIDDDEDAEEDFWEDYEYYEDERQEVLLSAIAEKMIVPTQIEFEKLYEAAVYNNTKNRLLGYMTDAVGKTLKRENVERFLITQAENRLSDPDYDIWRRMNVIEQLSKLHSKDTINKYAVYLDHEDIYLAASALRSLLRTYTFEGKGLDFVAEKIRNDIKSGSYRLLGIVTLGASSFDDQTREGSLKVLDKLFSYDDLNMADVYQVMDDLVLPISPKGYVSIDTYSHSTYDFISSIGLPQLAWWITKPESPNQRVNAREVFKMFPSGEKDIFMTTPQGKQLLRKLGIEPESKQDA